MKKLVTLLFLLSFAYMISCSTDEEVDGEDHSTESITTEKTTKKPLNPNGDSELAILMREMFDNTMAMKEAIEAGKKVDVSVDYEAILTATATEPEKVASQQYASFANAYITYMKIFDVAQPADPKDLYHGIVTSCKNCHQAMCPGPLKRIKLLEM